MVSPFSYFRLHVHICLFLYTSLSGYSWPSFIRHASCSFPMYYTRIAIQLFQSSVGYTGTSFARCDVPIPILFQYHHLCTSFSYFRKHLSTFKDDTNTKSRVTPFYTSVINYVAT